MHHAAHAVYPRCDVRAVRGEGVYLYARAAKVIIVSRAGSRSICWATGIRT